eukprot:4728972-Heterocapsa_arctica.AAC.1
MPLPIWHRRSAIGARRRRSRRECSPSRRPCTATLCRPRPGRRPKRRWRSGCGATRRKCPHWASP